MDEWDKYTKQLDRIHQELLHNLEPHLSQQNLNSYNAVRKPLDLYMEYLVAMSDNLNEEHRRRIVPLLALPLDSITLGLPELREAVLKHHIRRGAGFTAIEQRRTYDDLQEMLRHRCEIISSEIEQEIHPINFDLLWNGRLSRPGGNVFEANQIVS